MNILIKAILKFCTTNQLFKLESFSGILFPTIPEVTKSNTFFIIDNTRNIPAKGPELFKDDGGAWHGSSRT